MRIRKRTTHTGGRSIRRSPQKKVDGVVAGRYEARYDALWAVWDNAAKDAFTTYADAFFETPTLSMLTTPLMVATGNSPWMQSMVWQWNTVNMAWRGLRDTFLDNIDALRHNYNSPTDALFALLAENEDVLDDLTSAAMTDANPFIAYEALKLSLDAVYLYETTQLRLAHEGLQSELQSAYGEGRGQAMDSYSQAMDNAESAYTQAGEDADKTMSVMQAIWGLGQRKVETGRGVPTTMPRPIANVEDRPETDISRRTDGIHPESSGSNTIRNEDTPPRDGNREREEWQQAKGIRPMAHNPSYNSAIAKILETQKELKEKADKTGDAKDQERYKNYTILVNQFEEWSRHPNSDFAFAAELLGVFLDRDHPSYDKTSPLDFSHHAHIIRNDSSYRKELDSSIRKKFLEQTGLLLYPECEGLLLFDGILEKLSKGGIEGGFENRYIPISRIGSSLPLAMALGGSRYAYQFEPLIPASTHEKIKQSLWSGSYYTSEFTIESSALSQSFRTY